MADFSLLIATFSHEGKLCSEYVVSVFGLRKHCRNKGIDTAALMITGVSRVDYARNWLVNNFLWKTDCSHILLIDDDIGFNVGDLTDMFEWREYDAVGVMYPRKSFDWKRVKEAVLANPDIEPSVLPHLAGDYTQMFKLADTAGMTIARRPIQVTHISAGLMMISRDCLLNLVRSAQLPTIPQAEDSPADFPVYEFFRTGKQAETCARGASMGEARHFCELLNKQGGSVYGCPWIPVTHVGDYSYIGDLPSITRHT
ncbi:MAG: hypothetical protein LBV61_00405 [Burkholderiaceae bacterium]|jgi:hypothetical protein|nr:hypothetical protein [Burkholderiaceae bacterium]